jgi:hypothetical protein
MILESKIKFRFVPRAAGVRAYWCLIEATIYSSGRTNKRGGPLLVRGQLTPGYSAISSFLRVQMRTSQNMVPAKPLAWTYCAFREAIRGVSYETNSLVLGLYE